MGLSTGDPSDFTGLLFSRCTVRRCIDFLPLGDHDPQLPARFGAGGGNYIACSLGSIDELSSAVIKSMCVCVCDLARCLL